MVKPNDEHVLSRFQEVEDKKKGLRDGCFEQGKWSKN